MSSSGSYLKFEVQGSISTLGSQAKNKRSHPRCRRTLTLRASYTFFAFLLVLLYFQLWPSSLINLAVSIPTIDTAQNFRPQNDRDVPTKRASTLPNSEEATLHAPAAASPHEGTSVLNSPARASTLQETGKTVSLLRVESSVVEGHPATATSVESHVTTSTDLSTQSERSTMNVSVEPLKTGSTATLPQKDMLIADKSIALQNAKPDDTSSGRDPAIIDAPSLSQQSMINNASAQGMATTTTNNISLREESSVRNATVLLREAETATTPKQEAMHVAHDPVAPTDARVTVTPVRQDSAMIKPVRQDSAAIVLDASAFPTTKKEAVLLIPAVNYTGGAIDVIELARKHVEPASNITAAICYKTLFGDIDIGLVLQWVGTLYVLCSEAR